MQVYFTVNAGRLKPQPQAQAVVHLIEGVRLIQVSLYVIEFSKLPKYLL